MKYQNADRFISLSLLADIISVIGTILCHAPAFPSTYRIATMFVTRSAYPQ